MSPREGNGFTYEHLEMFDGHYEEGHTTHTSIRITFDGLRCTTLIRIRYLLTDRAKFSASVTDHFISIVSEVPIVKADPCTTGDESKGF